MEVKKTVGTEGIEGTRKDYVIHTACGEEFYAKATGSQGYECRGQSFKSVKDIKTAISNDRFSESGDSPASETSTAEGVDTWDCAHPCALLAHLYDLGLLGPLGYKHKDLLDQYNDTMDKYGWLDENSQPDIARANREINRVQNIKQEVQTDE